MSSWWPAEVLFLFPMLLFGQAQTTGRISGTVLDEQGAPVLEARVSFLSPALQGERVIRSDRNGRFLAAVLPVGSYAVTVAAPGKRTVQISLRVSAGQTGPLNIRLEPGEAETEKVTIYAPATPLETTVVGQNFNYDKQFEELPINDRVIDRVALLTPSTHVDGGTYRTTARVSISGAPARDTLILVDGVETSDPLGFDTPWLYLGVRRR